MILIDLKKPFGRLAGGYSVVIGNIG